MMRRFLFAIALVPTLAAGAVADEPEGADDEIRKAAEAVKASPDSVDALNAYMSAAIGSILSDMQTDPDAAQRSLDALSEVLEGLQPQAEEAQQMLARARGIVPLLTQRVTLTRMSLDDLEGAVREDPDDEEALANYAAKLSMELGEKAYGAPAEAAEILASAREFLAESKAKAKPEGQANYGQVEQQLDQLGSAIESNLAREQLVGKDAAPLAVEAWVNGEPLADSDLEGKVVLLDFWAVWCGPCIATFPHLIEWDEQYGDKGLVIIGLTSYYQFNWDDEAGRAVQSPGTTPEQERAMLEQFAEQHGLTHRFAIAEGDAMSEYYQVSGIPQVVVIDQQGKVRMVRVGSGEQNAKDVGGLIEELLGAEAKAAD